MSAANAFVPGGKVLKNYFVNLWKAGKPIARLFKTRSMSYLYDTGSNKVLRCQPHVFDLLELFFQMDIEKAIPAFLAKYNEERLEDAANKIKETIEKEGILLSAGASGFGLGGHYGDIGMLTDSSLRGIILETTENCNCRCAYCIYDPHFKEARNHGSREMTMDIAFRAIDYLKNHSYKKNKAAVTFYGGEPLLRFDFIKSCVEYAKSIITGKALEFSLTTNGTLLGREIARYFLENDFSIVVSIDGPKEIHNRYRKDINGNGSFEKAITGLKTLVETYGEKAADRIMLSMVYNPPYSGEKIDHIADLWDEYTWLPRKMNVNITYPSEGSLPPGIKPGDESNEDKPLDMWAAERFSHKNMEGRDGHPISDSLKEKKLAHFMQRRIYHSLFDKYYLNGCCVPGVRKLFVTVDGTFLVCEKISSKAPSIGNVFSGIDIETIKKVYIDEYEKMSLPFCSGCWAIRLCSICYNQAFKNGTLDMDRKLNSCGAELYLKENLLKLFCTLIEKNPGGLDYLYDFHLE